MKSNPWQFYRDVVEVIEEAHEANKVTLYELNLQLVKKEGMLMATKKDKHKKLIQEDIDHIAKEIKKMEHQVAVLDKVRTMNLGVIRGVLKAHFTTGMTRLIRDNVDFQIRSLGRIKIEIRLLKGRKRKDGTRWLPVDWGASNRKKEAMIKNGITPYDKETAPDGEPWLVYKQPGKKLPYFKWRRSKRSRLTPHQYYYSMQFTTGCNGVITELYTFLRENPFAITQYLVDEN